MAQNTEPAGPLLLKPEAVAQRLSFGRSKTYALLRRGEIKSYLVGGSRRVKASDVELFVENLPSERHAP
jgi:excisionase family DNA binding protein